MKTTPASLDVSKLPSGYGFCFEFRTEDKTEKIKAVLQRMVDEGNPEDFTTTGEPRVSVVKENLDGDVTKTEVMAVYDELMST